MSNHPAAQYLRGQLQQKFAEGGAFGDDCKNVLWTAGCTFASPQAGHAGCGVVLGTLACTLAAHGQQAAQGAVGADCKNVMWTAGCTFAGPAAGRTRWRRLWLHPDHRDDVLHGRHPGRRPGCRAGTVRRGGRLRQSVWHARMHAAGAAGRARRRRRGLQERDVDRGLHLCGSAGRPGQR